MVAPNHSIQWWWCPRKSLKVCDGSKKWAKVKQSTVRLWTRLNFAVVKALLSSPFIIINNFVSLWNWICCDYALFRSLFMSQNHRWPSHLKFVKTIEKPSLSMVNLRKNIQWWWSSGSKTIEKPSKAMVPQKKIITIPSSWKNYHRWSLTFYFHLLVLQNNWFSRNSNVSKTVFSPTQGPYLSSFWYISKHIDWQSIRLHSLLSHPFLWGLGRRVSRLKSI